MYLVLHPFERQLFPDGGSTKQSTWTEGQERERVIHMREPQEAWYMLNLFMPGLKGNNWDELEAETSCSNQSKTIT